MITKLCPGLGIKLRDRILNKHKIVIGAQEAVNFRCFPAIVVVSCHKVSRLPTRQSWSPSPELSRLT